MRKHLWTWVGIISLIIVLALVVVGGLMIRRAGPILKDRVTESLRTRFQSRVELQDLNVSVLHGLEVSGDGLRIYPPASVVAAGANQPLITVEHFYFHSGLIGLFIKPMHVGLVHVKGLQINIPPREIRQQASEQAGKTISRRDKVKIVVHEIICDNSRLIIGTANPDKDPKDFELKHIELHDVAPNMPWRYDARLINAIPPGEVHAVGLFGPWQTDNPGDSSVSGHYTFEHVDLNTINGLGGILSSAGDFNGQLNKIIVDGTTDTPDFSLDTANHPMPLDTRFEAVVDGTTGDTYLEFVKAKLRNSSFTTSGAVINIKGRGHTVELALDVPRGRLQDFLDLAVKTQPPVMTGIISTNAKLRITPGNKDIAQRLSFQGNFALADIHFTNPQVQDKVDMLSLRAQGEPKKAKPGAKAVNSRMKGALSLTQGVIHFSNLEYVMPGAQVDLKGLYSLDGQQFEFRGKLLTDASLAHMVTSPVLSTVLKIVPLFRRKGGGADIPVEISGTKSNPKFGLDVLGRH